MSEQETNEVQASVEDDAPILPEDLRLATAPISGALIREYFTNKNLFFVIDYVGSKLKGKQLLTYLTNLSLPFDIRLGETEVKYEDYAEFMIAYFEQQSVIECGGAHVMAADILLTAKGLDRSLSPYGLPVTTDQVTRFINENQELVNRHLQFIDSSQVYALFAIESLNAHYKPKERFPIRNDKFCVGQNIAALFTVPEFTGLYFNIPGAKYEMYYFEHQFEQYMFKNKRLAHYFGHHLCFPAAIYNHWVLGHIKPEDVDTTLFKIGVFDPKSPYYEPNLFVPTPVDADAPEQAV